MKTLTASLLLSSALLSGCAGHRIDFDQARKVKTGMTTKQLVEIMGKPYMITAKGGTSYYSYVYVNGFTGSTSSATFPVVDGKVSNVGEIPDAF